MNSRLFVLLCLLSLFSCLTTLAQTVETPKKKYTPYELMSSYYDEAFQPFSKHNVFVGFAFSLEDKRLVNSDYLFNHVIDGDRLNYSIEVKSGYFTGDYGMIGLTFEYLRTQFDGSLLSSDGIVFSASDTVQSTSRTNGYAFSPYFRSAIPVSANNRLSFFTEFSTTFGTSTTESSNSNDKTQLEKTNTNNFNFKIGLSPGLTFFALENFALEAQLDLLGYSLDVNRTSINDGPESKKVRQNVNFNINVLSLNLGLAYYFGAKNKK